MCRYHQGYLFRCPKDSGGCGNNFFQGQKEWIELDLVNALFDRAATELLQDPRRLANAKAAPLTLKGKGMKKEGRGDYPQAPSQTEVAIRKYCKLVVSHDEWTKELKGANLAAVRKGIGACDGGGSEQHCPDKKAVSLWNYFGSDRYTRLCSRCTTKVKRRSKQCKNVPERPKTKDLVRLPNHRWDDPDWLVRYSTPREGLWEWSGDEEWMERRMNHDGEERRSPQRSEDTGAARGTRLDSFKALTTHQSRARPPSEATTTSRITDVSRNTATSGATSNSLYSGPSESTVARTVASSTACGRDSASESEESDMYGPGSSADSHSRVLRASDVSSAPARSLTSTALSSLNRVRETDRSQPRDQDESTESRTVTTGRTVETASRASIPGGAPSSTCSQYRSLAADSGLSEVSRGRRTSGSECSVASSQYSKFQEPQQQPCTTVLKRGSTKPPSKQTTSRESTLQGRGKSSRWEDKRHVEWEVPGESGEEGRRGHREYHKAKWMTEEDMRENARRRLERQREDEEEQRRKDRSDAARTMRDDMDAEADDEGKCRHTTIRFRGQSSSIRSSSVESKLEAAIEEGYRRSKVEEERRAAIERERELRLDTLDSSSDLDDGKCKKPKKAKRKAPARGNGKERERDSSSRKGKK